LPDNIETEKPASKVIGGRVSYVWSHWFIKYPHFWAVGLVEGSLRLAVSEIAYSLQLVVILNSVITFTCFSHAVCSRQQPGQIFKSNVTCWESP